jgi:hypothetical protein
MKRWAAPKVGATVAKSVGASWNPISNEFSQLARTFTSYVFLGYGASARRSRPASIAAIAAGVSISPSGFLNPTL